MATSVSPQTSVASLSNLSNGTPRADSGSASISPAFPSASPSFATASVTEQEAVKSLQAPSDDAFGAFSSIAAPVPDMISPAADIAQPVMESQADPAPVASAADDEDWGDFDGPSVQPDAATTGSLNDNDAKASVETADPLAAVGSLDTSMNLFADAPATTPAPTSMTPRAAVISPSTSTTMPAPEPTPAPAPAPAPSVDIFGAFDDLLIDTPIVDAPLPQLAPIAPEPVKAPTPTPGPAAVLPAFDSAPVPVPVTAGQSSKDDEDEFGDFESIPAPAADVSAPATAGVDAGMSAFAAFDAAPVATSVNTSTASAMSTPSFEADFSDFQGPSNLSASIPTGGSTGGSNASTEDSWVKVNESSPSPVPVGASGGLGGSSMPAFDPFLSGASSVPPAIAGNSGSEVHAEAASKMTTKSPPSSAMSPRAPLDVTGRKAMKPAELETLAAKLFEQMLYEESDACFRQAAIAANIKKFQMEKLEAVENDDLEQAVSLKKAISKEQEKLAGLEDELRWEMASQSNRIGELIQDIVDLVCMLNPSHGAKCKDAYLTGAPPASVSMAQRARFYVGAKRSLRIITAIFSTHTSFPDYWKSILSKATSMVAEANSRYASFESLNHADKVVVLNDDKMKTYIDGIAKIIEIGNWVAATSADAMVLDPERQAFMSQVSKLTSNADSTWSLRDRKLPNIAEISAIGLDVSAADQITYCNFTLRPVAFTSGKEKKDLCSAAVAEVGGKVYLKSVLDFWTKEINASLPFTDCEFS
jgi:hypothetical protein